MKNKLIIGVVLIVIILGAGSYFFLQKGPGENLPENNDSQNTVTEPEENSNTENVSSTPSGREILIESDIKGFKYLDTNEEGSCGELVKLQSSNCNLYGGQYFLVEDYDRMIASSTLNLVGVNVSVSVHEGLVGNALEIVNSFFGGINLSPTPFASGKIYTGYNDLGSSHYWLSGNSEILVGTFSYCASGKISEIESAGKLNGKEIGAEGITKLRSLCDSLNAVTIEYLKKYPSGL